MADAGLIVLVAFISPYRQDRDAVWAVFHLGSFYEIFLAPLAGLHPTRP